MKTEPLCVTVPCLSFYTPTRVAIGSVIEEASKDIRETVFSDFV